MKKSSSENFISNNYFNAKPPLSLSTVELRLTRSRPSFLPGSLPTSPISEPGPFRSTSSSPRRHVSPDCVKLKLVSAGSSFCLVKDEPSNKPNDDINGRKSPFISTRTWPKALRTRSASKERISSKHGILYGSIEQIKAFQETKEPLHKLSALPHVSEKRKEDVNYPVRRSTSVVQIPPSDNVTERQKPRSILRSSPSVSVPRLQQRIRTYQSSIEQHQSNRQSTLPWNNKVVSPEISQNVLRKTASSPCLFVKKNSVNIKKEKTPIKPFGTITSMGNLIGETLSHVIETESEHDEIQHEASTNNARAKSSEDYEIKIPQSSNIPNHSINKSEAQQDIRPSKHSHSMMGRHNTDIAMEQQESVQFFNSSKNNLSDSKPVDSKKTIQEFPDHQLLRSSADSETEIESEVSQWTLRTQNSRLDKHPEMPSITSSSLTLQENLDCFDSSRESQVCDTLIEGSSTLAGESNINVTSRQQKLNEEQRNIYEAERVNCVNSEEEEEIQKELTSILPNGQEKPQFPPLTRPRFLTKPNMNERTSETSDIKEVSSSPSSHLAGSGEGVSCQEAARSPGGQSGGF